MAAEDGIAATEGVECLVGNEAFFRKHHVLRDAAVALAQDHAVAPRPFRVVRTIAQDIVVQHAHDFHERHRGADVAALAAMQRAHDKAPQILRALVERRGRKIEGLYSLRSRHGLVLQLL